MMDSDALVTALLPKIRRITRSFRVYRHPVLSTEDLVQEGVIGLIDAMRTYDATYDTSFAVYADRRMVRAIQDAFRRLDHLSRHVRRRSGATRAAEVEARFLRTQQGTLVRRGYPATQRYSTAQQAHATADVRDVLALWHLRRYVDALPFHDQAVIACYYGEGLSMRAIGALLGLTESRISQIHAKALATLRAQVCGETP